MRAAATDPIIAIATAPGRAAVGIVRVSSPQPLEDLAQAICGRRLAPRRATHVPFLGADGRAFDDGIALLFPAPSSYTGEHVLELQGHGGTVVLQMLLRRCLEVSAGGAGQTLGGADQAEAAPPAALLRLARPGEFSERAFLNGRLDLAQAEAVADLIDAGSEAAARAAARSLEGAFSREVNHLRDGLVEVRTWIEAALDFPEEDIDILHASDMCGHLGRLLQRCDETLAQARRGAMLRSGLHVVIVGQPNSGKSSLLNALAGSDRAIVTPVAGTTRDVLREAVQIDGVPVYIFDTAGLRDSADPVERIGIERAWNEVARADVVLFLRDASLIDDSKTIAKDDELMIAIRQKAPENVPIMLVESKIDLLGQVAPRLQRPVGQKARPADLRISTRSGNGLDTLRKALLDAAGWQPVGEGGFLARERHVQALLTVRAQIAQAQAQLANPSPALELIAEDLRVAQEALGSITGTFGADDLLGAIFSTFCIGK